MASGLFLVSAAILALQVLHMRILSVQMWYHHAFMVLTMAMLGFAVAGTVTTLWPKLTRERVAVKLAWCSTLFGVSVVAAQLMVSAIADSGLLAYGVLLLPYLFGGLVVTIALASARRVHDRYFVNLIGSALGAWLFIAAITPLGAERLLILCAALGPVAALCFHRTSRAASGTALLALVLAGIGFWRAQSLLEIRIAPDKRQHLSGELLEQRWTPLSRLDLLRDPEDPGKINIVQDGAAGTYMHSKEGWGPRSLLDSHTVAYVPHLRRIQNGGHAPEVLVIGVGGGYELREAMSLGAERVLGIEINAEMARITGEDYASFNGNIFQQPGVSVVVGEGRSTLRRLEDRFDIIVIAGADTYTAGASGAFVLSESYLYTTEALADYVDHLKPGGTLGVLRFYDKPPRETLRMFGMALLELRRRGIEKPSRHVAVMRSFWGAGTVLSLKPLHPKDIEFYAHASDDTSGELGALYLPGLEQTMDTPFTRLAAAVDSGAEEGFYEDYVVDVRPVSDDSPFFFNFHHVWDGTEEEDSAFAREFNTRFPVAPSILRALLLQASALVLVLVLLPLLLLRRSGLKTGNAGRHLTFFCSVGLAFMFLEISTVQRLVLFLGHPTYSLTVVLFCFLFFAGLGSLWSGRVIENPVRGLRATVLCLAALILILTGVLGPVLGMFLHVSLAWRVGIAICLLAPLNFLMGMPFPLAIARLGRQEPELVPWAIGANGGASVIGSVLAVMIAMESGFTAVSLASLVIYLIGMLAATTGGLGAQAESG